MTRNNIDALLALSAAVMVLIAGAVAVVHVVG